MLTEETRNKLSELRLKVNNLFKKSLTDEESIGSDEFDEIIKEFSKLKFVTFDCSEFELDLSKPYKVFVRMIDPMTARDVCRIIRQYDNYLDAYRWVRDNSDYNGIGSINGQNGLFILEMNI